jgi:BRCT domain type II-containing protein
VAWRQSELSWIPYPIGIKAQEVQAPQSMAPNKCAICFTGFREKDMEAKAVAAGFRIAATLSSKVSILVTPDPPAQAGAEKLKRAQELGTKEILNRSEFTTKYLTPR